MDTIDLMRRRISANRFDRRRALTEAEIRLLVEAATQAPSSYNIQHWRFVAVTDPLDRKRLMAVANGQKKVLAAPCVFIVLGDLEGYRRMPEILDRAVRARILERETTEGWIREANERYADRTFARDEAIRSAALAAMNLMIAAEARDMVSGPMIGFDPEGVKREFGIPDRYVPVLLICVGYRAPGNLPRKPRLGVHEVLSFDRFKGED